MSRNLSLIVDPDRPSVFHCITRVSGGQHLLKSKDKDLFISILHKVAGFHRITVQTFCFMSNHYHLQVRVPSAKENMLLDRNDLLDSYNILYQTSNSPGYPDADRMRKLLFGEDEKLAKSWDKRIRQRLGNLSEFMKTLNQRLSICYNKKHGRFGSLWAERFKGILIEDDPYVLSKVGAYIDLNPVRAGLVDDPSFYRWSGFAAAMAGQAREMEGIKDLMHDPEVNSAMCRYRYLLYAKGSNAHNQQGMINPEKVKSVLASGGTVSHTELLHCRIRYLSAGLIIGTRDFVGTMGKRLRALSMMSPPVRDPTRIPFQGDEPKAGLYSYRRLVKTPIA